MQTHKLILVMIPLLTAIGCNDENRRLAEMAERHLERQAEQSRHVTDLQREVAEGSRRLVEADAKARQEFVALQREIQVSRSEVDQQRDLLAGERREMAAKRRMDPIVAAAIVNVGLILACLLPLVLCWLLLKSPVPLADDQAVAEVLLEDLVADRPLLLQATKDAPAIGDATDRDSHAAITEQVPSAD